MSLKTSFTLGHCASGVAVRRRARDHEPDAESERIPRLVASRFARSTAFMQPAATIDDGAKRSAVPLDGAPTRQRAAACARGRAGVLGCFCHRRSLRRRQAGGVLGLHSQSISRRWPSTTWSRRRCCLPNSRSCARARCWCWRADTCSRAAWSSPTAVVSGPVCATAG